jgi:hypothetical protein
MKKDFQNLSSTFRTSIKTWNYLVDWNKVHVNSSNLELILNKLNYLLGKADIRTEFFRLYENSPDIVKAFPTLLAVRESKIEIYEPKEKTIEVFDFSGTNTLLAEKYFEFLEESGLVKLFKEDGVKNLVDYVLGVEVGLDSNGRKNRGGTLMESIVEVYISDFCSKYAYDYIPQATAAKIKSKWGFEVEVDKSSRSFDFAIYNPISHKLKLVETNFYNGGGSKLKAVCGEFKGLSDELERQGIDFIWVTDGLGWRTTLRPLEEVYNHNKYTFNLSMLENNILSELEW